MAKLKIDCIIGIDCGKQGAISTWRPNNPVVVKKMPENIHELSGYFQHIKDICQCPIIFIEKVQLQHRDMSGGKAFRMQPLFEGFTSVKLLIEQSKIPFIMVNPMKWQAGLKIRLKEEDSDAVNTIVDRIVAKRRQERKVYNLEELRESAIKTVRKNRYVAIAQKYYPEVKATLWNSDALLICHFGRFMNFTNPEWIIENLPKYLHNEILFE